MDSRSRMLGGLIPGSGAPVVGMGIRVLGLSPFTTEWYAANQPTVTSINGSSGALTLTHSWITDWAATLAPYALLSGPVFVGNPQGPTPATADNSTTLATTAFVKAAIAGSVAGVSSFNTRQGAVTLAFADITAVFAAGSSAPLMDGVAAIGIVNNWARADHVHPSDTSRLALAGGTLTGVLTLAADPASALQAATKQYVDNAIANALAALYVDCGTF